MLMTVKEFVEKWADGSQPDIDVYDDVCEELAIAYCGCLRLTDDGERHFEEVLGYTMEVLLEGRNCPVAIIYIDSDKDGLWEERLEKASEFFYSAAGYCPDEDFQKWFIEVEE